MSRVFGMVLLEGRVQWSRLVSKELPVKIVEDSCSLKSSSCFFPYFCNRCLHSFHAANCRRVMPSEYVS
jgi:hypothetical protein